MMRVSMEPISISLCLLYLLPMFMCSYAIDSISGTQAIVDGGETIVSSGGSFEMGFFSPGDSKNRYVGIWYKKIPVKTAVWVANRETPLHDTSGMLKVNNRGLLVVLNGTNHVIWSSNASISVQNPVAQLLDSGNLVVRDVDDDSPDNFVWQSFYSPGNTLLPGMKLGNNFLTGRGWYYSSWKSDNDPAPGNYTYQMDDHGYPELILWRGTEETYRSGPWNGIRFSGSVNLKPNPIYRYNYVYNESEVYYSYELLNSSVVSRRVLSQNGVMQRWTWVDEEHKWTVFSTGPPFDNCDAYALCGAYGSCDVRNAPICGCLNKFVPKDPGNWDKGAWSSGCIRRRPLACENGDGFLKYSGIKLPETRNSWFSINMTLKDCWQMCLANCSCMAYSNLNISGKGSGCLLWFGGLIDIKVLADDGQDIFVRMASSEIEEMPQVEPKGMARRKIIVVVASTIGVLLLCLVLALFVWKKRRLLNRRGVIGHIIGHNLTGENQKEDLQLRLFDVAAIENATDNFSLKNMLGEGGFGPVYKGVLEGGQEIAVKRLSSCSTQGLKEFKNEVICIAKLQHRNLVKLLGCCDEGEEKMLIYEYMPNKSLDFFIFDPTQSALLSWTKRFNIINGISRGILYLHQDSRLRIIHRDLKASNILLDIDMNPKIADFGMARIFGGNETEANTRRVVGTHGYMSPEYQVDGIFSVRSDVFSFGVLVLEIVTGNKNRGFSHPDHNLNLLGHAWMLYNEGRSLELIDVTGPDSCYIREILRSIHVALLCVQQYPEDRPSMSTVVLMLSSDIELPQPKQPGFFTQRKPFEVESSTSREICSPNEVTITMLSAR